MLRLPRPERVQAKAVTENGKHGVKLSWSTPQHAPNEGFAIKYSFRILRRRKGSPEFSLAHQSSDHYYSHTVQGLRPATEYEFCVQTFSIQMSVSQREEDWPLSEIVTVKTLASAPASPPRDFHVTDVTQDTITVAWQVPKRPNGAILSYKLFYDVDGTEEYDEVILPGQLSEHTVRFLRDGTLYRFQLLAVSEGGEGPCTPICCKRTRHSQVRRVLKHEGGGVSADDFSLAWDRVDADNVQALEEGPDSPITSPVLPRRAKPATATRGLSIMPARRPSQPAEADANAVPAEPSRAAPPKRVLLDDWVSRGSTLRRAGADQAADGSSHADRSHASDDSNAIRQGIRARLEKHEADAAPAPKRDLSSLSPRSSDEDIGQSPWRAAGVVQKMSSQLMSSSSQERPRGLRTSLRRSEYSPVSEDASMPADIQRRPLFQSNTTHRNTASSDRRKDWQKRRVSEDTMSSLFEVAEDGKLSRLLADGKRTIRGKRHAVRRALGDLTAQEELLKQPPVAKDEPDNCAILYTTSTKAVRETWSQCQNIKKILYNMRISVKYKDVTLDPAYAAELERRLPGSRVPHLFFRGRPIGDGATIERLNESGALKQTLAECSERAAEDCVTCGGDGFILCTWCQGSRRSRRHPFEHDISKATLKCTLCNVNGLQRCPDC